MIKLTKEEIEAIKLSASKYDGLCGIKKMKIKPDGCHGSNMCKLMQITSDNCSIMRSHGSITCNEVARWVVEVFDL